MARPGEGVPTLLGMTPTPLDSQLPASLLDQVSFIAQARLRPTVSLRHSRGEPALDALLDLGLAGFLVPMLSRDRGGAALPFSALAEVVRILARDGEDPGMAMLTASHGLCSWYCVARRSPTPLRDSILESLARGQSLITLASTDPAPATGLPPTLRSEGKNGATLSGAKTGVVGAPVAEHFVVIATGETSRERTAMLVRRDEEGVDSRGRLLLPVARTCPVGNLSLQNARAGRDRMIGRRGQASVDIEEPYRAMEETLTAAIGLGLLEAIERRILEICGRFPGNNVDEGLGSLQCGIRTAEILTRATIADAGAALLVDATATARRLGILAHLEARAETVNQLCSILGKPAEKPELRRLMDDLGILHAGRAGRRRGLIHLGRGLRTN